MLWTRLVFGIWSGAILLLFLLTQSAAAMVLIFLTTALAILSGLVVIIGGRQIEVEITSTDRENENKKTNFDMVFRNKSYLPIFLLNYQVIIHNTLTNETEKTYRSLSLGPKAMKRDSYSIESEYCGCLEISVGGIKVVDFFRIFRRSGRAEGRGEFYLIPEIKLLDLTLSDFDSYDMESYEYSSVKKGDDPGETFDIKAYSPGDSSKAIHWKLSSKLDEMMVKEASFPIENSIIIMLDTSIPPGASLPASLRNNAAEMFISLSQTMLDSGFAHTVTWFDHKTGSSMVENISNDEDLWSVMLLILRTSYTEDEYPASYHYIETVDDERYANYIYVTPFEENADIERLEELGAVTVFRAEEN